MLLLFRHILAELELTEGFLIFELLNNLSVCKIILSVVKNIQSAADWKVYIHYMYRRWETSDTQGISPPNHVNLNLAITFARHTFPFYEELYHMIYFLFFIFDTELQDVLVLLLYKQVWEI